MQEETHGISGDPEALGEDEDTGSANVQESKSKERLANLFLSSVYLTTMFSRTRFFGRDEKLSWVMLTELRQDGQWNAFAKTDDAKQ